MTVKIASVPLKKAAGRYHHGDLRTSLITAAAAIVKRSGPDAVTMRAVAARAGVSEAAPYHHFRDKRDLLAAAAADGFRALGAALADATDLGSLAEAWTRFALHQPGAYRLILGAHVVDLDLASIPETRAAGGAARELVLARIRAELPGADPAQVFRLLWAQLHGTASLFAEKELGPGFTEADAIALARDGVERLSRTFR
jgi:AcrR family transcriptional regulator